MDSPGNANHDISVVGYWIFESNNEKSTGDKYIIIGYNLCSVWWLRTSC